MIPLVFVLSFPPTIKFCCLSLIFINPIGLSLVIYSHFKISLPPFSFFNYPIGLNPAFSSHNKISLPFFHFLIIPFFESCHFQPLLNFTTPRFWWSHSFESCHFSIIKLHSPLILNIPIGFSPSISSHYKISQSSNHFLISHWFESSHLQALQNFTLTLVFLVSYRFESCHFHPP